MDLNDNAVFEEFSCVEYDDSANESCNEFKENVNVKDVKQKNNKITVGQSEKLMSAMAGRTDNIAKGKLKSDEATKKLLREWDELTIQLNSLGPPCHSSAKWRRIWSKKKCKINQQNPTPSVHYNRVDNKKPNDEHSSTSNQFHQKLSVDDGIEGTVKSMESERLEKIEQQLLSIANTLTSVAEQQVLANETMNKKLDILATQQADIVVSLNLLALKIADREL